MRATSGRADGPPNTTGEVPTGILEKTVGPRVHQGTRKEGLVRQTNPEPNNVKWQERLLYFFWLQVFRRKGKLAIKLLEHSAADLGLVPEMAGPGKDHGNAVVVRGLDDLLVPHRAARLDDRGGAGLDGGQKPVSEREESRRSDHRAFCQRLL